MVHPLTYENKGQKWATPEKLGSTRKLPKMIKMGDVRKKKLYFISFSFKYTIQEQWKFKFG